jgi:hypothetical protein
VKASSEGPGLEPLTVSLECCPDRSSRPTNPVSHLDSTLLTLRLVAFWSPNAWLAQQGNVYSSGPTLPPPSLLRRRNLRPRLSAQSPLFRLRRRGAAAREGIVASTPASFLSVEARSWWRRFKRLVTRFPFHLQRRLILCLARRHPPGIMLAASPYSPSKAFFIERSP